MVIALKNTVVCPHCGRVLQYDIEDIEEVQSSQEHFVTCPKCGWIAYVDLYNEKN